MLKDSREQSQQIEKKRYAYSPALGTIYERVEGATEKMKTALDAAQYDPKKGYQPKEAKAAAKILKESGVPVGDTIEGFFRGFALLDVSKAKDGTPTGKQGLYLVTYYASVDPKTGREERFALSYPVGMNNGSENHGLQSHAIALSLVNPGDYVRVKMFREEKEGQDGKVRYQHGALTWKRNEETKEFDLVSTAGKYVKINKESMKPDIEKYLALFPNATEKEIREYSGKKEVERIIEMLKEIVAKHPVNFGDRKQDGETAEHTQDGPAPSDVPPEEQASVSADEFEENIPF
jgi:hypothetical protein